MGNIFEGLRVIDLSTYIAAPTCARLLASLGAEVIKIEPVKGEIWRTYGKVAWGLHMAEDDNIVFDIFNCNKKSLPLNLKDEKGKEIMHKLLATADVFITNTREQSLKSLGFDYTSIKDKYPKLIYASILGYGDKGPDKDAPGFDTIAFWARSGFLVDQSVKDSYPVVLPGGFGDTVTGTTLFGAVAAALYKREKTGEGDKVDVSLYGSATYFAGYTGVLAQPGNDIQYPKGRYEGNPLQYEYKTKDGEWIAVAVVDVKKDFDKYATVLGLTEWVGNPKYNTKLAMVANSDETIHAIENAFAQHDYAYWDEKLTQNDIVHTRLKHYSEILSDPQALANDYSFEYEYPSGKRYLPNIPMHFANEKTEEFIPAPLLGADTEDLLSQLGYSHDDIELFAQNETTKIHD